VGLPAGLPTHYKSGLGWKIQLTFKTSSTWPDPFLAGRTRARPGWPILPPLKLKVTVVYLQNPKIATKLRWLLSRGQCPSFVPWDNQPNNELSLKKQPKHWRIVNLNNTLIFLIFYKNSPCRLKIVFQPHSTLDPSSWAKPTIPMLLWI